MKFGPETEIHYNGIPQKQVKKEFKGRDGHLSNGSRIDRFIRRQVLRMSNRILGVRFDVESATGPHDSHRVE